jgi:hypothetical protein
MDGLYHERKLQSNREEKLALLDRTILENGLKEYKDGIKPTRNLYRAWLANGFRLGLETDGKGKRS